MGIKLKIDAEVHNVDLTPLARFAPTQYFLGEAGTEPYKLLAYLSSQLPRGSKIADLGTRQGASAAALARNPQVQVTTYDIDDCSDQQFIKLNNVTFVKSNCLDFVQDFADAALVHLDLDPHDGVQETLMLAELLEHKFKGLLVCDDICLNNQMKRWWRALGAPIKPIDVTRYGHWSGTGVVVFNPKNIDVEVE